MPGLDHKGPQGEGPMTGRKAGECTNFIAGRAGKTVKEDAEGNAKATDQSGTGQRGAGRGKGFGQGRRQGNGKGQGQGGGSGSGRGAGRSRRTG